MRKSIHNDANNSVSFQCSCAYRLTINTHLIWTLRPIRSFMTLTCHRRRILRPACCSRAGPQPGSTPGSPDPSPSTCCTAELHRSVLATLCSSHHHKLVFSDCKHTDSSYMSLCRSSSRPDFKLFISQAMSFPYLTVLLILQTKIWKVLRTTIPCPSSFLSTPVILFSRGVVQRGFCVGISHEKWKTHSNSKAKRTRIANGA